MMIVHTITARDIGRDPDYIDLNINFTIDLIYNLFTIRKFPTILRPYVTTSLKYRAGHSLTELLQNCREPHFHYV